MANEVRVRLDEVVVTQPNQAMPIKSDVLDDQWMGKSVRRHVQEFATLFAIILSGIAAYRIYRFGPSTPLLVLAIGGFIFGLLGYRAPRLLHPLWKGWMKFAHYLSIVMTFVIMLLTWSIGFVPMAFILNVLRIKRMDLSYRSGAQSYWEDRDPKYDDFQRLKLQF